QRGLPQAEHPPLTPSPQGGAVPSARLNCPNVRPRAPWRSVVGHPQIGELIDLQRGRVHVADSTRAPDGVLHDVAARQLTDEVPTPLGRGRRFLSLGSASSPPALGARQPPAAGSAIRLRSATVTVYCKGGFSVLMTGSGSEILI